VSERDAEFEEEQGATEGGEGDESSLPEGDLQHYDGQWVAVRDGRVVAAAADEEALRAAPAVREGDDVYPIGDPPSGFYFVEGSV
jgi:Family of unknown function (DUF5678)